MTDNEIIKALKCCQGNVDCANCPYYENNHHQCGDNLNKDVLDLINRQQAEIDELNNTIDALENFIPKVKAEAIKEFAERLKDLKHECGCNYRKKPVFAVTEDKIDNLVQEMVGDSNAE